jgi:hypothetical protein
MDTKARTRTGLIVIIAAMAFGLLPAAPASAGNGTWTITATAVLSNGFVACGDASFSGTVSGIHGNSPTANTTFSSSFTYCNDLVHGTAEGQITLGGHTCHFFWIRTGVVASIAFSSSPTSSCWGSGTAVLTLTSLPVGPGTVEVTAVANTSH